VFVGCLLGSEDDDCGDESPLDLLILLLLMLLLLLLLLLRVVES
jgi:hypothetical protein